jgi:signal peptidase I
MKSRLINALTWLLVAGSVAIILGGLLGRPVLVAAVPTTSMVPVLHPGDLIPVIPAWGSDPTPGEIVVYKTSQDTVWIVHRVIGGDSVTGYIIKGDANPEPDQHRVFPKDIAGFVPTIGRTAIHIPGLGSLSLGRSPFSHPLFAGVALALGIFLLVNDMGTGMIRIRWMRMRRRKAQAKESKSTLFIYLWLAILVFIAMTITNFSLRTEQTAHFNVVQFKSANVKDPRLTLLGFPQGDPVLLNNPSFIPVVIGLTSNDPDLVWEPAWVFLSPSSHKTVSLTRKSQVLGEHTAELRQAIYLPMLPIPVIRVLASISWSWPIFATAMVPVLLIMAAAFFDRRARTQWQQWRLAFHLRFWA